MGKAENNSLSSLLKSLLYRNQFVLCPFFIEELTSWKKIKISSSILLTVHPDLETYQAFNKNKSITLLGYILDPDNPRFNNADIVDNLILKLSHCDNFFEHTYAFGGRWILIVNDGKETRLLNDAAGLRQVFYTDPRYTKQLWCASQPGLIADILNLQMDKDAVDFIHYFGLKDEEYWWPGDSSPYKEIRHLLPNRSLNLENGLYKRYWPNKDLGKLSLDEAVKKISATLQGIMKSAFQRFDLALSLTAGWDSRLALAASKEIRDRISYMTVRHLNMPENHPDVRIPSLLLLKLGLKHEILKSTDTIDTRFKELYKKSVTFAHDVWAPDAQAILNYYSQNKVAVTGSVSEIVRDYYRIKKKSKNKNITPYGAITYEKIRMGENEFAINHFEKWLSEADPIFDIDIDNLFYWEQRAGNWIAMCQLEFDSAWKDIFTPFNCRNLLIDMLSVEEEYRKKPKYVLYRKLMVNLWPEVLSVPINPRRKKSFYTRMKSFLQSRIISHLPSSLKKALKNIWPHRDREA